jgi:hypothetical protein
MTTSFYFFWELGGLGIGYHKSDVASGHPSLLDAERPDQCMHTDCGRLHVQPLAGTAAPKNSKVGLLVAQRPR